MNKGINFLGKDYYPTTIEENVVLKNPLYMVVWNDNDTTAKVLKVYSLIKNVGVMVMEKEKFVLYTNYSELNSSVLFDEIYKRVTDIADKNNKVNPSNIIKYESTSGMEPRINSENNWVTYEMISLENKDTTFDIEIYNGKQCVYTVSDNHENSWSGLPTNENLDLSDNKLESLIKLWFNIDSQPYSKQLMDFLETHTELKKYKFTPINDETLLEMNKSYHFLMGWQVSNSENNKSVEIWLDDKYNFRKSFAPNQFSLVCDTTCIVNTLEGVTDSEPKYVTFAELGKWLAENKGQYMDSEGYIHYTIKYHVSMENDSVKDWKYKVRPYGEGNDWVEPTTDVINENKK